MNKIFRPAIAPVLLTAFLTAPAIMAKDDLPDVTEEGLQRVKDTKWAAVYEDPDAIWTDYTKVIVLEPYVAFKKNWMRDQNRSRSVRVNESDMEKIKVRLAQEFDAMFREVLQEDDGYPVVEVGGEDTMILRPAIIDLDVNAPDTMRAGRGETYADSAGAMTIYLEIYDSITGDLLAKGIDRKADRSTGFMNWQTSASNAQAAKRILRDWAQSLRDALDEVHHGSD